MTLCLRTVSNQISGQRRAAPARCCSSTSIPCSLLSTRSPGADQSWQEMLPCCPAGRHQPGSTGRSRWDKNHGMQIENSLLIPKESHLGFCLVHLSPPIFSLPQENSKMLKGLLVFHGAASLPNPSSLSMPCSRLAPVTHRARPQGTLTSASLALKPNKKLFIDTQV